MAALLDLDVRQLAALRAVAEEGTFGRAATKLGFTQSAVSQQVASLERTVGMRLFDRPGGPRPPALTPAGSVLLDHARAVLDRLDHAADELDRLRRGIVGKLEIGTFQSISTKVLPTAMGRFRAAVGGVDVRLTESDDKEELIEKLLADELDLSFHVLLPGEADDPRLELISLGHDPYVVIAPAGRHQPVEAFFREPMVGMPAGSSCQDLVDDLVVERGFPAPTYAFRSVDNGAVQAMVRSGLGAAIMPFLAIDPNDAGIEVLQFSPDRPARHLTIARRRGRTLPPAADQFIATALEVCEQLLEQCPAEC